MVLVSSKTAPQTGPAPSAVQGQAGASRGPGQIPNCPQHGGLGLGACPVFWNANCTSASSLQQEGAAGFLFSVPELGFPRAQAQKSSWENRGRNMEAGDVALDTFALWLPLTGMGGCLTLKTWEAEAASL